MIDNVTIIENGDNGDVMFTYDYNNETLPFNYSDLAPYWEYATSVDSPYFCVHAEGDNIVGVMTVSDGQGGIAFIWDAKLEKLVHLSEASFGISVTTRDDKIYVLSHVVRFTGEPKLVITETPIGVMDPFAEGKVIPSDISYPDCLMDAYINSIDFGLIVVVNDTYTFDVVL